MKQKTMLLHGEVGVCDHARQVVYAMQLKYGWTQNEVVACLVEAASHRILDILGVYDAPTTLVQKYLPDDPGWSSHEDG